jgi:hypothetical protein
MSLIVVHPAPCSDIDGEYVRIDGSESNEAHRWVGAERKVPGDDQSDSWTFPMNRGHLSDSSCWPLWEKRIRVWGGRDRPSLYIPGWGCRPCTSLEWRRSPGIKLETFTVQDWSSTKW